MTIENIKRGTITGIMTVILEDGSSFFMLKSRITARNLKPGVAVTQEDLLEFHEEALEQMAYQKGVDLLSRREHSEYELSLKLIKREYPRKIIRMVMDRLKSRGYLDDRRFAEEWITFRLRKHPEGPTVLRRRLKAKGVSEEIISQVLGAHPETQNTVFLMERAAEKLLRDPRMTREKLIRSLYTRGFSYSIVQPLVDRELAK